MTLRHSVCTCGHGFTNHGCNCASCNDDGCLELACACNSFTPAPVPAVPRQETAGNGNNFGQPTMDEVADFMRHLASAAGDLRPWDEIKADEEFIETAGWVRTALESFCLKRSGLPHGDPK